MIYPDFDGDLSFLEMSPNLIILCNSTVIEMYDDMIRISDSFDGCQSFR